jgi:uncharacterized RDD family membrane protein YckC
MTPNLLHYSTHSQKISPAELEMNKTPPYKSWKTLAAFFIDFYIVAIGASLMTFFFQAAVGSLMVSPKMSYSLMMVDMNSLSFSILPFIMLGYFAFAFYMNEGQTFGMSKMKVRFENTGYDFKASLLWAARSASVIMTLGVSMLFLKDQFKDNCVSHDHLYRSFMFQREWAAPSLVERTTFQNIDYVEEDFRRAA